jgi:predicted carbohydrate-binding protein with CBM5 and CBM33 domain
MVPPAPARFSTTTGWPSEADSFSATRRATTSVEPPAGNGTTIRTGRDGKVCAATGKASVPARPASTVRRLMNMSFS